VVSNWFLLGETTHLGQSKRINDLVALIEATPGVSYSHVYMEVYKELVPNYYTGYSHGIQVDAVPMKTHTVSLYVNDTVIAVDNGAGTLTDVSSGYTISGSVDYNTGVILAHISPTPASVYVRYQQNDQGDIVVLQNQICQLLETDITNYSYDTQ